VSLAAAVSELHGVTKDEVLALEKVRPEAACRTGCFEGITKRPKFVQKSMPIKGVATAVNGLERANRVAKKGLTCSQEKSE
jgi:hypothetical protein